ncbi:ribosome biogenesis factor YjgA [Succinimonas amylolytica]|uniref:ribosome biogenesis factor YjgA n=1 Tax=Succinimonas amylolytica TaxID=83769 RepID=UPI0023A7A887
MQQDHNNFYHETDTDDGWVSRSSRKRHSHQLRDIGKKLVSLSESEFNRIPFGDHDSFREACLHAKKLKPRSEELRREFLHIESLMRSLDESEVDAINTALEAIQSKCVAGNAAFHRLEELRDSLINEGMTAINRLIGEHPEYDRQKLRNLTTRARMEMEKPAGEKRFYRELFKYLRDGSDNPSGNEE